MYSLINGGIEIVARIGLVYLLTAIPFIGTWGIFLTTGLTWLITAIFALVRYKGGAWVNKSLVNYKSQAAKDSLALTVLRTLAKNKGVYIWVEITG